MAYNIARCFPSPLPPENELHLTYLSRDFYPDLFKMEIQCLNGGNL